MSTKKKIWLIIGGVSILLVALILGGFVVVFNRLELVDLGLSSPNFPYNKYTQEELKKIYPENIGEGVLTVRTPEQTHRMFVDKLKEGDLDGAAECCFVKKAWSDVKVGLKNVAEGNSLNEMIGDLDVELKKDLLLDTKASYYYTSDDNGGIMEFVKDRNGVWLIESL